jgi:glutamine amidotransferase
VKSLKDIAPEFIIPHVGWNEVERKKTDSLLLKDQRACFYFVHSFYCEAFNPADVSGITEYGKTFDSVIEAGNVLGCQFHPEKSQKAGINILKAFAEAKC